MSASSGISVAPDAVSTYNDLKSKKAWKYIIFSLNKTLSEISVVDKFAIKAENKLDETGYYDKLLEALPENECRWAVYDLEFDTGEGKRNKLIFFSWAPDTAGVRQKMVSASSKDALRRTLDGIGAEVQGTDPSEVAYETILEKVTKRR
ncbi:hypothetical protein BDN72DRAFT_168538 [Pluteus cervinus]|uniref:Uncharacterized protein n=1 Tax=Pluteus cervinus TaxID=181527 RepID=A0ACD3B6U3_9AGAR|nr:hypothetical protein BDN72DRAFT_168538 [Pluteus cervinus]